VELCVVITLDNSLKESIVVVSSQHQVDDIYFNLGDNLGFQLSDG
jgi:hypothetical protein